VHIYLKESKPAHNRDKFTPMFITALFAVAKYGIILGAHQRMDNKNVVYITQRNATQP
jgi:hypothetical protein